MPIGGLKKQGIDFFMSPTLTDPKTNLIEKIHGHTGHYVVHKMLQLVYGDQGYFMAWNGRLTRIYCAEWRVEVKAFDAILDDCIEEGIFDKEMYNQHGILTSAEIQASYFTVVQRRKFIRHDKRYLLIDISDIIADQEAEVARKETDKTEKQAKDKKADRDIGSQNADGITHSADGISDTAIPNSYSDVIIQTRKEASEAKQEKASEAQQEKASEAQQVSFFNSVPEFSSKEVDEKSSPDWKKIGKSFNQESLGNEEFTHGKAPQTEGGRENQQKRKSTGNQSVPDSGSSKAGNSAGKKSKKAKKKVPHPIRAQVIAAWEKTFGQVYTNNFKGNGGICHIINSLSNTIKHLEPELSVESLHARIAELWEMVLHNWGKIEPYLQSKIQFEQISNNITNIINQLKINGSASKNTANRSNPKPSYSSAKSLLRASLG